MIRINLLPEERRRKEKTPLPRFLAMNAAIIVCLLLGIWNVYMYVGIKQQTERLRADKVNLTDLQKQTLDYNKMLTEEKKLSEWNKAAEQIKNTREFRWWEKIDELWDVIYGARDVWITSLQAIEAAPPSHRSKTPVSASISMGCFATGMSSDRMTSFRMKLKAHQGLKETFNLGINEPAQFSVVAQPQYKEEFAVKFDIDLSREKKIKK
jgi:Tfp pilus assembly protein PilN